MSLPWSSKGVKATPVNADELLILDSADANLSTKNKRITIGSLAVVAGEINTSSNSGAGNGWALPKSGVDLPFKSLITTSPISTTVNTNDLTITLDALVNANISATAAIDFSKLASLSDGNILVGSNTNVTTSVALSGDATLINTGAITISNNAINDNKIISHTSSKITITTKGQLNSTIVYTDQANLFGTFTQSFPNTAFEVLNPAGTFGFIFTTTALTADRTVTLPLLTGNDTFVFVTHTQTLSNKTLALPIITDYTNATHNHGNAAGGGNLTNSALTSGVFSNITGIGVQSQALNMNSNLINSLATPLSDTDAATKQYVDNAIEGLAWKDAAVLSTTANITLSGNQTIDGILTLTGDRILVKNQSTASGNGLYLAAIGAWSRTTDADTESKLLNMSVFIQKGTVNADTSWVLTTDAPITIGVTALNYAQIAGSFNSPLTTKGDILAFDTGNNRLPVGTNGQVLTANSAVALGVEWTAAGAVSQTPWVSDIDADGFDLQDLSNIEFRNTTLAPGAAVAAIYKDVNGIKLNTPSTTSYELHVAGTAEYTFNATELNTQGNNITIGAGSLIFSNINTSIIQNGNDIRSDVATSGSHIMRVNDVEEYEFNATQADFKNNNLVNVKLLEINNPADTFQYIITGAAIAADRILNLPLLTGADTVVTAAFTQTLTNKTIDGDLNTILDINETQMNVSTGVSGTVLTSNGVGSPPSYQSAAAGDMLLGTIQTVTAAKTFNTATFLLNNPANTFAYTILGSAITAARTVTIPLLTGNDIVVMEAFAQTLTNKTLTTPTIASFTNATHNHTNAAGGGNIAAGGYAALSIALADIAIAAKTEALLIAASDESTALTTGTAKTTFRMPYAFTLTAVRASLTTAGTGAALVTVDINETGTTILSTKITIDATEKTSTTAATPAVISDSSLADDAEITIDIDTIDTGGVSAGLKIYLIGYQT